METDRLVDKFLNNERDLAVNLEVVDAEGLFFAYYKLSLSYEL